MKNELSAWSMLAGAVLLGAVAAASISGCRPPDRQAGYPVESNATAEEAAVADNSNTTTDSSAANSNLTTDAATPEMAFGGGVETETPEVSLAPANETVVEAESSQAPESKAASEAAPAPEAKVAMAPEAAAEAKASPAGNSSKKSDVAGTPDGDWPQWGGTSRRNNVPDVSGIPNTWSVGEFDRRTGEWDQSSAENIKWYADLGSQSYGNAVVADGRVFVGTNNGHGYLPRYSSDVDLGCLVAFDEETGEFLWQHSSEKLITGRVHDWPLQGICSASLVEGDRLWFVTSRGEVRCLDTNGFYDGEDNGPVKDEVARVGDLEAADEGYEVTLKALNNGKVSPALEKLLSDRGHAIEGDVEIETVTADKAWELTGNIAGTERQLTLKVAGPRLSIFKTLSVDDKHEADVIWVFDMMAELGVSQHNMASCSVTSYGDLLFVNTSNGLDETHINLPAPGAPSFICMDKNTAEVYWTDKSPGTNILHGQWSSPAIAEIDGEPQVFFAGGDGWLYSFRADKGQDGNPTLLWKFDCNPKESKWALGGAGTRNNIIATPVVYDGLVYIAVGQDPEHGEGEGHLWCIDPTKEGDVSPQRAMKVEEGDRVPIEHKRLQAVDPEQGEVAVDNPNSAVVWHYSAFDQNDDGEIDFEEEIHRSCGTVAIKDDVLYIADFSGILHCLDAKGQDNGQPIVHFTYDMFAQSWGSPLIADGHVYIGDEDGDVAVFEFGPENKEPIEEINMGTSVYSTPIAANGTIFISTKDKLFAIASE